MKLMPQSPSSVGVFNTCPKQYEAKYITKEVRFEPNEATQRGERFHSHLEHRISIKKSLPKEAAYLEPVMRKLEGISGEVRTEFSLAINDKFRATDYKQRWIGGKIDLGIINHEKGSAFIFDYKTGKVKDNEDFRFQLKVYALLVFKAYPHVKRIRAAYLFVDHCEIMPAGEDGKPGMLFTREDIEELEFTVQQNIARIASATERNEWLPNPGPLCRPNKMSVNGGRPWCQVKSCPFWNKI